MNVSGVLHVNVFAATQQIDIKHTQTNKQKTE